MLLQELQIEGFRSLKSVTWRPGRLNVLIGPNGGGKSNLMRALELIRLAANAGLRKGILRLGGMAPLVWDGEAQTLGFKLDFTAESSPPQGLIYHFELTRVGQTGGYEITGEEAQLRSWDPTMPAHPKITTVFMYGSGVQNETRLSNIPEQHGGPEVLALRRNMQEWSIHSDLRTDENAEIRKAAVTRQERRVDANGENLIAVLHTLYANDREFEAFIDQAMEAAFPDDFEKLKFAPAEDGRTQLRVQRKHRKRADSAADLSDGTLRFLLLLAILGSPDPAPLIAIDEPETGLHPRMLPIIAAVAANTAVKTQVVLTTHSPMLLDAFSEDLPATTVVTWNGSATELRTIAGDDLKYWVENYSLGKFAFSGEAEAVL
jgi:predicted ATPase